MGIPYYNMYIVRITICVNIIIIVYYNITVTVLHTGYFNTGRSKSLETVIIVILGLINNN